MPIIHSIDPNKDNIVKLTKLDINNEIFGTKEVKH
jgi:hypothetical protein